MACEEASETGEVYYVGWGQSMSEVAPGTSLVTARICWEPYVVEAVDALMAEKSIEDVVTANVRGTDAVAGFEKGWIAMEDLNQQVAAPGTQEAMDSAVEKFVHGDTDFVFCGDYTGVKSDDPSKTIDLRKAYIENENTSHPLFDYILTDIVTIVEE